MGDDFMDDDEDYGFVSSRSIQLFFFVLEQFIFVLQILYVFQEYEDDSGSEPDVDLENQYYTAKGLKSEGKITEAIASFERVGLGFYG